MVPYPSKKPVRVDFAQGRLKTSVMNATETEYAQRLELQLKAGEILWYRFEAIKLVLPGNVFYTPDFMVVGKDNVVSIHEVKGFWTDDARVKIRIAAGIFPFHFLAIKKRAKKLGGGCEVENF
jgi:hypothetical protein